MAEDLRANIPADVRNNHPEAVECALESGEVPLPDGTWRAADGRVVDPQFGDGKLVPLNATILYGMPVLTAILIPITALTVGFGWQEFAALVGLWWLTGLSITAGYHRLFSHNAYKASWPLRVFFAIFGAMAMQNSILIWSRDHRYHHGMVDTIGDPYNAKRGFWFSHFAWVLHAGPHTNDRSNVADLENDPIVMFQHRHYNWFVWVGNFAVVGALGALTDRWLQMFVIAGLLRLLWVQHGTFFINSWAHTWGRQPWSRASTARDSWILSLVTFGEGYHNYHHTFANDYRNGVLWYHFDPSKWLIWTLARLGLASDLKRVPLEVTLRVRLDETRKSFSERLATAGEGRFEEWAGRLAAHRDSLALQVATMQTAIADRRTAMGLQILAAEQTLNEGLKELRQRRRELSRLLADASARAEVAEVRRALRSAQRQANAHWDELQRLVQAYGDDLSATRPA